MFRKRRSLFALERLERRDCPSFVFRLTGDTLFVTGTPTQTAGTGSVSFTLNADDQWKVQDNGNTILNNVHADNIYLSVTQHNLTPITFNLNGHKAGGNILVNLGTGDHSQSSSNGLTIYNGTLGGDITALKGSGGEVFNIGFLPGVAGSPTTTIGGNVEFIGQENPSITSIANPPSPFTNTVDTGLQTYAAGTASPTVIIGGSLTTFGAGGLDTSPLTNIGGNITATNLRNPFFQGISGVNISGTVGGNVTIHGAAASSGDDILISNFNSLGGSSTTIGGNLSISLGTGNDSLSLANIGLGLATIEGNTVVQVGDGNNQIALNAIFNGGLTTQLGNGNNTDASAIFGANGALFTPASSVSGNFSLTAGNGNNNLTPAANGGFAGAVSGNTNFTFGNGIDSIALTSTNLSGPINWHSGNGNDTLNVGNAATPANYNLNAVFGNGDDSFGLVGAAGTTLSGKVDGGGRITANQFFQAPGDVLAPFFQLSNFP